MWASWKVKPSTKWHWYPLLGTGKLHSPFTILDPICGSAVHIYYMNAVVEDGSQEDRKCKRCLKKLLEG